MTDTLFFIDEDEVLAHHGVKGMKWGVRKQRAASGGAGSTKKRKGLSRKQKAAIAGVLGTAAAAGAGYYLHKSGKGKQLAGLAKKGGASAKKYAQGKGRNLGAQARVKTAQAFGKDAKTAASKLKYSKAGKYAEATRLAANAAAFKTANAAKGVGYGVKRQAWKAGNKARRAAAGGVSGAKSAAGMAARTAKAKAGSAASAAKSAAGSARSKFGKKAPGNAVGFRKVVGTGTKVVRPKGAAADKLVKASVAGLATGVGGGALQYATVKAMSGGKKKRGRSGKRRR